MIKVGQQVTVKAKFDNEDAETRTLTGEVSRVVEDDHWFDLKVQVTKKNKWGTSYKEDKIYLVKLDWIQGDENQVQ